MHSAGYRDYVIDVGVKPPKGGAQASAEEKHQEDSGGVDGENRCTLPLSDRVAHC